MLDRLFMPALVVAALAAIALAMAWPQGYGDRSPAPFGSTPFQRTPAMQAAMRRENESAQQRTSQARASLRTLQTQAIAPSQ